MKVNTKKTCSQICLYVSMWCFQSCSETPDKRSPPPGGNPSPISYRGPRIWGWGYCWEFLAASHPLFETLLIFNVVPS